MGAGWVGLMVTGNVMVDRRYHRRVLEFILAMSVIGIAALLLPVLRPHGEAMAVGYVAVRTLEAAFILMATTTALLVLALGQDSGSAIAAGVEPVGGVLLSAREWTYFVGTMPLFGVSAVILNTVLYRSRLVPAWLSLCGSEACSSWPMPAPSSSASSRRSRCNCWRPRSRCRRWPWPGG